jgi:hypothetical protein
MNIPWSDASIDENVTIDLIVNTMTLVQAVVNILGKELQKVTHLLKHMNKLIGTFQKM